LDPPATNSLKRNSSKGTLILKKELIGTLILSKRNSLKGTLILSKGTKRNTHHGIGTLISKGTNRNTHHGIGTLILKRNSYQKDCLQPGKKKDRRLFLLEIVS